MLNPVLTPHPLKDDWCGACGACTVCAFCGPAVLALGGAKFTVALVYLG